MNTGPAARLAPRDERTASHHAFASGKIILAGEHAVVYGMPAIACGIDKGTTASAAVERGSSESTLSFEGALFGANGELSLCRAFRALLGRLEVAPMRVGVESTLPPGCGLGASAAQGVAVAKAVLGAAGRDPRDWASVRAGATAWEEVFHGNPSGIDVAAARDRACIRFVRGSEPARLPISTTLRFAVAIAGPPASTKRMVDGIARLREERPAIVDDAFRAIGALSVEAERALATGDRYGLGAVLDANHEWLRRLGVSTPQIESVRSLTKASGALGAKLTGSGGGGAVIALVDGDPDPVLSALARGKIQAFVATVGPIAPAAIGVASRPNGMGQGQW